MEARQAIWGIPEPESGPISQTERGGAGDELNGVIAGWGHSSVAWGVFLENVSELFFFKLFQSLSLSLYIFESFNQGFRHAAVSFFRTSYNSKFFGLGDAFVAVLVVQAHAQ